MTKILLGIVIAALLYVGFVQNVTVIKQRDLIRKMSGSKGCMVDIPAAKQAFEKLRQQKQISITEN